MRTLLFYEPLCVEDYIKQLLANYPYDIAESLVDTLLTPNPYPHPSLMHLIDYVRHAQSFLITANEQVPHELDDLFTAMCMLSQRNNAVLHIHQFRFDAVLHLTYYPLFHPYTYLPFDQIACLDHMQIPKSTVLQFPNQAVLPLAQIGKSFSLHQLSLSAKRYFAVSVVINNKHGVIVTPREQIALLVGLSSLYALCTPPAHPDFYLCYGMRADKNEALLSYDQANDIHIGYYAKKDTNDYSLPHCMHMIESLYAWIKIKQHDLCISASMMEVHHDEKTYGICICGTSFATISVFADAFRCYMEEMKYSVTNVFENYGTLHLLDDDIYASGAQLGAAISAEALEKQRLLSLSDSSLRIREGAHTSLLLAPFTSYEESCLFHHVNVIWYLDDTTDVCGKQMKDMKEALHYLRTTNILHDQDDADLQKTTQDLWEQFLNTMFLNDISLYHVGIKRLIKANQNGWQTLVKQVIKKTFS